jgi:hypothetical protein
MKRQTGSIHQMTAQLGYSTLREAFMMANSQEDLKKINSDEHGGLITDQVLRILIPRLNEFLKWVEYSEKELRKRFSIERNYLKSQVETIKLYSGWMKPYLIAAEKLKQKGFDSHEALVNSFSTSMFQLEIFTEKKASLGEPHENYRGKRDYKSVMVIDFEFRGHVSQRVTQKGDYGFGMGGKINIVYKSYALNDEEIAAAKALLEKADRDSSLNFSGDVAAEALADLKEDLDYFLMSDEEKEANEEKTNKREGKKGDINPFSALFGLGKSKKKKKKKKEEKKELLTKEDIDEAIENIKKDNFVEKMLRGAASKTAATWLYFAYDIYKKAHQMASAVDEGFDTHDAEAVEDYSEGGDVGFFGAFKKKDSN